MEEGGDVCIPNTDIPLSQLTFNLEPRAPALTCTVEVTAGRSTCALVVDQSVQAAPWVHLV
jgi:hypothetical protein